MFEPVSTCFHGVKKKHARHKSAPHPHVCAVFLFSCEYHRMIESSRRTRATVLSPTPYLPATYLGGEKQRTCQDGRIWNSFPTGLGRTRKVYRGIFASTSILGSVRTVHVDLGRSSDVFSAQEIACPLTAYTPASVES